ncbi:MAG: hypothetical protein HS116_22800 [Planctomycetes bacterium]|nr:hypothetical protein [Planctomycetota bacterium]
MSTLRLRILDGCNELYVQFIVDGKDLGARVKAALGVAGYDDVLPWYGGDYRIEDTVLGEPARRNGADGAILFACGCGQYACSGVSAQVVISGETLTLCEFSTTGRDGQKLVAPIQPVVFDRGQFEDAVRQLECEIANWRPAGGR